MQREQQQRAVGAHDDGGLAEPAAGEDELHARHLAGDGRHALSARDGSTSEREARARTPGAGRAQAASPLVFLAAGFFAAGFFLAVVFLAAGFFFAVVFFLPPFFMDFLRMAMLFAFVCMLQKIYISLL